METVQERRKRMRGRWSSVICNPPMKLLTWAGLTPGHMLIETRGRRTGKRRLLDDDAQARLDSFARPTTPPTSVERR